LNPATIEGLYPSVGGRGVAVVSSAVKGRCGGGTIAGSRSSPSFSFPDGFNITFPGGKAPALALLFNVPPSVTGKKISQFHTNI
jgi:hypothetical protein